MAERYNITTATARKRKQRDHPQDRSYRPHRLATTLSPAQELLAVELRRTLLRPLDNLLVVIREFISTDSIHAYRPASSAAARSSMAWVPANTWRTCTSFLSITIASMIDP